MIDKSMIKENISKILEDIEKIKLRLGIKYPVNLMAVTKTRSVEEIEEVLQAGITLLGENRIQEAHKKFTDSRLKDKNLTLHIIGHLQRNKIKKAMDISDFVESIDKIETLDKLNFVCNDMNKICNYLIEVNTSGEEQKNGILPNELDEFIEKVQNKNYSNLNLRGLMTVGPLTDDKKLIRDSFKLLKKLFADLQTELNKNDFDTLSMGMSGDYEIAIEEGSNLVRIGTGIFGRRIY